MARIGIVVFGLFFFTSCGTKKIIYNDAIVKTTKELESKSPKEQAKKWAELDSQTRMKVYALTYAEIAQTEMRKYGIPASITLAQGLLESQAGMGELALKSNNHFGIKCHQGWNGPSVSHDDDAAGECFRKYKRVEQSYRDHSEFLSKRGRYSDLFKLNHSDYVSWAHGLKKAGYATDPQYAYKLISLIERFELWKFDGTKKPITTHYTPKQDNMYAVQQGDTLYSISKKLNISVEKLMDLNALSSTDLSIGQQLKLK